METRPPRMSDEQVVRTARTIWAALFISLGMYLVTAFQMGNRAPEEMPNAQAIGRLQVALSICAVISYLLAFSIPRFLRRRLEKNQPSGNGIVRFFPFFMLRLALLEAVALYGLVLAAQASSGRKMWPFLVLSAFGFSISFPSKEKLEAM
jgi:hypothetical protein